MAKRMNRGLVALSSAAILSVYGAGYVLSQPPATMAAASDTAIATTTAASRAPATPTGTANTADATPTVGAGAAPASASPAAASPAGVTSSSAAASTELKDGTYTGSGTSRHGGVSVSVTIQNGRIISAAITNVSTRYSQNVISGLPSEALSAQGADINLVSGATDSSEAYVQAVQQALAKASTGATMSAGTVQVTSQSGVIYNG
ncbi:MAG: FMN-binding protein [Chloroflexi bacterium]|nr:FMN-binding protein [Chloroflexota bacterium]